MLKNEKSESKRMGRAELFFRPTVLQSCGDMIGLGGYGIKK